MWYTEELMWRYLQAQILSQKYANQSLEWRSFKLQSFNLPYPEIILRMRWYYNTYCISHHSHVSTLRSRRILALSREHVFLFKTYIFQNVAAKYSQHQTRKTSEKYPHLCFQRNIHTVISFTANPPPRIFSWCIGKHTSRYVCSVTKSIRPDVQYVSIVSKRGARRTGNNAAWTLPAGRRTSKSLVKRCLEIGSVRLLFLRVS